MKTVLNIEFTGLAKGLSIDETCLAEPDLAGFLPSVGDTLVLRDWPGNAPTMALVCKRRRVDLTKLSEGELHVHIALDKAPPELA